MSTVSKRRSSARAFPGCLLVAAGLCLVAQSSVATQPPDPKDLMIGHWVMQPGKSKFCTNAPQQSVRDIIDVGWGLLATHWTGVDNKGAPVDIRYLMAFDGRKLPADITKRVDIAITWKRINPHRVEFVDWSKDGKALDLGVRTISKDGQTMTQTMKFPGRACVDLTVFARQ